MNLFQDAIIDEMVNEQCRLLRDMICTRAGLLDDPWELAASYLYLRDGEPPTTKKLDDLLESL